MKSLTYCNFSFADQNVHVLVMTEHAFSERDLEIILKPCPCSPLFQSGSLVVSYHEVKSVCFLLPNL